MLFHIVRFLSYTFSLAYFRIEFEGTEHVPSEGPVIIAPNHESYFDPIWVSLPFNRPLRYMTWDRMFKVPILGTVMRAFGAFPVNVKTGDRGALKLSLEHLKSGGGLVIFPEGSRTRDGDIQPFKQGVIRLALETGAPIVPVTIIGGYRALAPHHRFPRPVKVKVVYHEPLELAIPPERKDLKPYLYAKSDELRSVVSSAL